MEQVESFSDSIADGDPPRNRRVTRMRRRLFYCDHYPIPLPPGHKFPMEKYALLRGLLQADGFFDLEAAPLAARETIELAHDPAYVRSFLDGSLDARALRRIGFPWSEFLVRRTLASVGGTLAGARDALAGGMGGNLAGGTHHAFRSEGAGFCVFNDLAVAILALRQEGRIARAAVIDLDVHQGDGAASIFEDDPEVLTFSMHADNNFPFRKQRSKLDIGLADGAGDEEYLRAASRGASGGGRFSPGPGDLPIRRGCAGGRSSGPVELIARGADGARRSGIPVY